MDRREIIGVTISLLGIVIALSWAVVLVGIFFGRVEVLSPLASLNILAVGYGLMELGFYLATKGNGSEASTLYGDRGEIGLARGAPFLTATPADSSDNDDVGQLSLTTVTGLWLYVLVSVLILRISSQFVPLRVMGVNDFIIHVIGFAFWMLLPLATHYDTRYVKTSSDWDTDVYWWLGFIAFPAALLFAVVYLYRRRQVFGWRAAVPWGFSPLAVGYWQYSVAVMIAYWVVIFVAPELNVALGPLSWVGLAIAWLGLPLTTYLDIRFVRTRYNCKPNVLLWVSLAFVPGLNLISGLLYLVRRYEVIWLAEQGPTSPRTRERLKKCHTPSAE